ncbi:hypothetical protein DFJ73DRAFT_811661 [Zopfochytrium polystomum]|nr:hypothetical protein DFJ73DRAFT_811661 [Zopfochytrium polystomum]
MAAARPLFAVVGAGGTNASGAATVLPAAGQPPSPASSSLAGSLLVEATLILSPERASSSAAATRSLHALPTRRPTAAATPSDSLATPERVQPQSSSFSFSTFFGRGESPQSNVSRTTTTSQSTVSPTPTPGTSDAEPSRQIMLPASFSLLQLHVIVQSIFGLPTRTAPHSFKTLRPSLDLVHPEEARNGSALSTVCPACKENEGTMSPPRSPKSRRLNRGGTLGRGGTVLSSLGGIEDRVSGFEWKENEVAKVSHTCGVQESRPSTSSFLSVQYPLPQRNVSASGKKRRSCAIESSSEDLICFSIVEPDSEIFLTPYATGCYIMHSNPFELPQFGVSSSEDPFSFTHFDNIRDERIYKAENVLSEQYPVLIYESEDVERGLHFTIRLELLKYVPASQQPLDQASVPFCLNANRQIKITEDGRVTFVSNPSESTSELVKSVNATLRNVFATGSARQQGFTKCHLCTFHRCSCTNPTAVDIGSRSYGSPVSENGASSAAGRPCCEFCLHVPRGTHYSNMTPAMMANLRPGRASVAPFSKKRLISEDSSSDDDVDERFPFTTSSSSTWSFSGVGGGRSTASPLAVQSQVMAFTHIQDDYTTGALYKAKADELRNMRRNFLKSLGEERRPFHHDDF